MKTGISGSGTVTTERNPRKVQMNEESPTMNHITLTLIVLFTQAVWAQDWARTQLEKSPRHREWVTVKHDGRYVETFVVYPEFKDKRPVVLFITSRNKPASSPSANW